MKRYQQNKDNISSKIQDEIVMVNIILGKYFSMNPVASSIWDAIEKPQSIGEICQTLMEEYDIDEATCTQEVSGFLNELEKLKIINITED